jgi:predicted metal-binding protein
MTAATPKPNLPTPAPVAKGRVSLAKAPAAQTIFICTKCAKKLPGKPGAKAVRAALKAALKRRSAAKGWGRVRIVQTGCFDLCPKRRQVLASGRTLAQGKLVVVDADMDAEGALEALLG